jgi:hypothetical protein
MTIETTSTQAASLVLNSNAQPVRISNTNGVFSIGRSGSYTLQVSAGGALSFRGVITSPTLSASNLLQAPSISVSQATQVSTVESTSASSELRVRAPSGQPAFITLLNQAPYSLGNFADGSFALMQQTSRMLEITVGGQLNLGFPATSVQIGKQGGTVNVVDYLTAGRISASGALTAQASISTAGRVTADSYIGFGVVPIGTILAHYVDLASADNVAAVRGRGFAICDGTTPAAQVRMGPWWVSFY